MSLPLDRLVADNLDLWTSATVRKSSAGRAAVEKERDVEEELAKAVAVECSQQQTLRAVELSQRTRMEDPR